MTETPHMTVPTRAVPTFELLAQVDQDVREAIVATLRAEPPALSVEALQRRVAEALGGGDSAQPVAQNVVRELFGMSRVVSSHGYEADDVAATVAASPKLDLEDDERSGLHDFLSTVLASPAVQTLGKAVDLATEHDQLLHVARIVTDIRPIFAEVSDEPVGGLITHRLRLSVWRAEGEREMEVVLTANQLEELGTSVDRARTKAQSLQRLMGRISLPSFDTDDEG